MKSSLTTFARTISDTSVYPELINRSFYQALGYFIITHLIFSVFAGLVLHFLFVPQALSIITQNLSQLPAQFPPNTTVTIQDGTLSVDPPENSPIILSLTLPEDIQTSIKHLLIIDPQAAASSIDKLDTLALMNASALIVTNLADSSLNSTLSWSEVPEAITFKQSKLESQISTIQSQLEKIQPSLPFLIPLLFTLGLFISRIFTILFYSLISYTSGWISGRSYSYRQFVILSLYTAILAQLIQTFNFLFLPGNLNLFPIAFVGINLIATYSLKPTNK